MVSGNLKNRLGYRTGSSGQKMMDARINIGGGLHTKDARSNIGGGLHSKDARSIISMKKGVKESFVINPPRGITNDARALINTKRSITPGSAMGLTITSGVHRGLLTVTKDTGSVTKDTGSVKQPFVLPKKTVSNEFYSAPVSKPKKLGNQISQQSFQYTQQNMNFSKNVVNDIYESPTQQPIRMNAVSQKMVGSHAPLNFSRTLQNEDAQPMPGQYKFTVKNDPLPPLTTRKKVPEVCKISPIQGYRIDVKNLNNMVSNDDVYELFSSVGQLRTCSLLRPGHAEVVFSRRQDALSALKTYHERELDGQPMKLKLLTPIETTSSSSGSSNIITLTGASQIRKSIDVDQDAITKALFNTTSDKTAMGSIRKPVNFNVKL